MTEELDVVFITLNEAHHLRASIESLRSLPVKIYIVDSGSTDRTVDIALEMGAHLVQRPFKSFGDQWNFALRELPLKAPWTMKMDPDERMTEGLARSILALIRDPQTPTCGAVFQLRMWFMGKPLHVIQRFLRLWKRGNGRFSDVLVNEHPLVSGPVTLLDGYLEHLDCENLFRWVEKQNVYTTMEAAARISGRALATKPRLFGTFLERRMVIKRWFFAVPGRYFILWFWLVFRYGVWRDGRVGLAWAHLRTEVYRMWEYKMMEMENAGAVIPAPSRKETVRFDSRVPYFE